YDNLSRISTVTNPYRSASDPTYGVTTTKYDPLDRVIELDHPGGTSVLTSYIGKAIQVQDEGNGISRVTRISQVDGLNRLVAVCEVTNQVQASGVAPGPCNLDIAGTGFLTQYQYDTVGNLTGVQQGGVQRAFFYDSLSRLQRTINPESGTTSYDYDAAGNVKTRIRPRPNQGD